MLLLSLESSAVTASAALFDGSAPIKSEFLNNGLTHSETLLPMAVSVMQDRSFSELDAIAVSTGPGSFTGVRIGVATAKGIAFPYDIPCISVSPLEAAAYNFIDTNCTLCCVMDARRNQFYNALFKVENKTVTRLCDDRAVSCDELQGELSDYDKVIVAGDGARLFCSLCSLDNVELAPQDRIYQNAVGVALAAQNKKPVSASMLAPVYLRPSQAERQLELKRKSND